MHLSAAGLLLALTTSVILVFGNTTHFLYDLTTASHNASVRLLVLGVLVVERVDAVGDILLNAPATAIVILIIGPSVIFIPRKVDLRCAFLVSEQHVLRVIVDEIFLFGCQVKISDEFRYAKLMDDIENIEL